MNILRITLKSTRLTQVLERTIKPILSNKFLRLYLNKQYNGLSYQEKKRFHQKFAKIYRKSNSYEFDSFWNIWFLNKQIKAPISKNDMWLTWDSAVSILGHDVEIKSFYESLLNSTSKPKVFFDVGANYGTHSLIFTSQGVSTYSFEPNPNCYPYFEKLFESNSLNPNIIAKAVGSTFGKAVLSFPEKDTWLGSLDQNVKENISKNNQLLNIDVEVTSLDLFSKENNVFPDLIKIDTEGYELNVLSGSENLLKNKKPIIVFECNSQEEKAEIFQKLSSIEYVVLGFKDLNNKLNLDSFKATKATNFIAHHKSKTLPNKK